VALPLRDDHAVKATPWLTLALFALNIVVFLFVQPAGYQSGVAAETVEQDELWQIQERDEFSYRWGAVPCEVVTGAVVATEPDGCGEAASPYLPEDKSVLLSLLTAMFLHGSIDHLAGNMLFLWVFGRAVEERLGRRNFAAIYLIGGVLATLGFVATNPTSAVPLVGASGAIAVAMGAYLVLFPAGRVLTVIATASLQVVYVPAAVVLALYFVTQFFTADDQVAWQAHAAGMVAGVVAALLLARVPAVRRRAADHEADRGLRIGREF
jgi:membrane associated rhomboid family serine protease